MTSDTNYFLDNEVATAPRNQAGTGTIETNKLGLIGSGTVFKTELARGAFIVDLTNGQVVKVAEVISDTYAILEDPFTTEISAGTALDYIPAWKGNAREISYITPVYQQDNTTENSWASADGVPFAPGTSFNPSKVQRDRSSGADVVRPVILDATGTQISVTITF